MKIITNFSIYDNPDYFYQFHLQSTGQSLYPAYKTKEYFSGRKCFEASWSNSNSFYVYLINDVDSFAIYSFNSQFFFRYYPNSLDENDFDEKALKISWTANNPYMYCFDTIFNYLILINGEFSYEYKLPSSQTNQKYQITFEQGSSFQTTDAKIWFNNDFTNKMIPGFTTCLDNRKYINIGFKTYTYIKNSNIMCYLYILLLI